MGFGPPIGRESHESDQYAAHSRLSNKGGSRSRTARLRPLAPCCSVRRRFVATLPSLHDSYFFSGVTAAGRGTWATFWTTYFRGAALCQWIEEWRSCSDQSHHLGYGCCFRCFSFLTCVLYLSAPVFRLLCVIVCIRTESILQ